MKLLFGIIAAVIFAGAIGYVVADDQDLRYFWTETEDNKDFVHWEIINGTKVNPTTIEPAYSFGGKSFFLLPLNKQTWEVTYQHFWKGEWSEYTLNNYYPYPEIITNHQMILDLEQQLITEVKRQITFEQKLTELQAEISELKYQIELLKGN